MRIGQKFYKITEEAALIVALVTSFDDNKISLRWGIFEKTYSNYTALVDAEWRETLTDAKQYYFFKIDGALKKYEQELEEINKKIKGMKNLRTQIDMIGVIVQ